MHASPAGDQKSAGAVAQAAELDSCDECPQSLKVVCMHPLILDLTRDTFVQSSDTSVQGRQTHRQGHGAECSLISGPSPAALAG